jgi:hypothetical protein
MRHREISAQLTIVSVVVDSLQVEMVTVEVKGGIVSSYHTVLPSKERPPRQVPRADERHLIMID